MPVPTPTPTPDRSAANGSASASVIPFPAQPRPDTLFVEHVPPDNPVATVIVRHWPEGQARWCRLCPRDECGCSATGVCVLVVPEIVPAEKAALHGLGS